MYCKTRGGLGGGPGRGLPVRAQTVSDVVVHMLEKTEVVIFTVFSLQKLLHVRFQNKSGFCVCILYVIRIQSGGVEMPLTKIHQYHTLVRLLFFLLKRMSRVALDVNASLQIVGK